MTELHYKLEPIHRGHPKKRRYIKLFILMVDRASYRSLNGRLVKRTINTHNRYWERPKRRP